MTKINSSGKFNWLQVEGLEIKRGKRIVHLTVTDDTKWYHEAGYKKTYTRVLNKRDEFSIDGFKFNCTDCFASKI